MNATAKNAVRQGTANRIEVTLKKMKSAIRAECAAQGIADDMRKEIMYRLAGTRTSTQLDFAGAAAVLSYLRGGSLRIAVSPMKDWRFVFNAAPEKQPLLKKLYRLAEALATRQGKPVTPAYCAGILAQMRGRVGGDKTVHPLSMASTEELKALVTAMSNHLGGKKS